MTRKKITTITLACVLVGVLLLSCISFCACDKKSNGAVVNYSLENDFAVSTTADENYTIFEPTTVDGGKVDYKYGLIFYVGTAISPENYTYLGNALAKQGYLVVIPNILFAYFGYKDVEQAFAMYPNVQFFVGGHSQGGGAAIRRASECAQNVKGVILYAPLAQRHLLLDQNGEAVNDENGINIWIADSLVDVNLRTLLLEASNDHVLTDDMKKEARARLNSDTTSTFTLTPGAHMSFSTMDNDTLLATFNGDGDGMTQEQKDAQRDQVLVYTLAFMQTVVLG